MAIQNQFNSVNTGLLSEMFGKQIVLQTRLKKFPLSEKNKQAYINETVLALVDEVMEALRETPWKSWKKNATYNKKEFRGEIVDIWHFIINLSLAAGFTPKSLHEAFMEKNKENHTR